MHLFQLIGFAFLASLLNTIPIFRGEALGDLLHQYSMIECFGSHVWTGHLSPHWCLNTNAGYGSPMPIFYFPLPYYFATIFYPLRYAGFEFPAIYQITVFATHMLTFAGAYAWLKTLVVKPSHAALGAALFLLMPYRTELVFFRGGYAELFCLAIIPWLFVLARNWAGTIHDVGKLAAVVALGLLSHPSVMGMAYLLSFPYILVMSPPTMKRIIAYGMAGALAICVTSPHWAAMHFFTAFLQPEVGGTSWLHKIWLNNFFDKIAGKNLVEVYSFYLTKIYIATIAAGFFLLIALCKINQFQPPRKDIAYFAAMALVAFAMTHSSSQWIWQWLEVFMKVKIPWRMFLFPSFFVVAIITFGIEDKRSRTISYATMLVVVTLSIVSIAPTKTGSTEIRDLVIATQRVLAFARPRWVDRQYDHENPTAFFDRFVFGRPPKKANLAAGGDVHITQWDNDGLAMITNSTQPDQLVLEHFYFPLWRAEINGHPAELKPLEDGTGRMGVDVAAGQNNIIVSQDFRTAMPAYFRWIYLVSLVTTLYLILINLHGLRQRRVVL